MELLLIYLVIASLLVYSSIRLCVHIDTLDENSSVNGALIGGVLLAGVTSLPELVTSLSSTIILNNPQMAFGNILGSNAFNLFILALVDMFCFKQLILKDISKANRTTTNLLFSIYVLLFVSLIVPTPIAIANISIISIFILGTHIVNLKVSSSNEETDTTHEDIQHDCASDEIATDKTTTNELATTPAINMKKLLSKIAFLSVAIIALSLMITFVSDKLSVELGLGSSVAGALFLGVATSLPEVTSLVTMVKLKNYNIAIANIVGSNLFNFGVLALVDIIYRGGNVIAISSNESLVLILISFVSIASLAYALSRKKIQNTLRYIAPTAMIAASYVMYLGIST